MDLPLRVVVVVSADRIAGVVVGVSAVEWTTESGTVCAVSLPSVSVERMLSKMSSSSLTEMLDDELVLESGRTCLSFTLTVLPFSLRISYDLGSARFLTIVPRRDQDLSVSYRIRTGAPGLNCPLFLAVSSVGERDVRIDGI